MEPVRGPREATAQMRLSPCGKLASRSPELTIDIDATTEKSKLNVSTALPRSWSTPKGERERERERERENERERSRSRLSQFFYLFLSFR